MGRFGRSWQTFKTSLRVVKQDKELLWLPVLSGLASFAAVSAVLGLGWIAGVFPEVTTEEGGVDPVGAILALLLYLGLAFVQTYFYAAMVAGAHERLSGGDPTVGSALRAANGRLGKIFLWSLVLATVNILLQALRERAGTLGRIAAGIAGVAWNLATYFVVPILMFEPQNVGGALKRSGQLFKKTWGESVVGEYGIGFAAGLMYVAVVVVGLLLTFLFASALGAYGAIAGIVLLVAALIVLTILVTVVQAVYKTELYRFAAEGQQDPAFGQYNLQQAFHGH